MCDATSFVYLLEDLEGVFGEFFGEEEGFTEAVFIYPGGDFGVVGEVGFEDVFELLELCWCAFVFYS